MSSIDLLKIKNTFENMGMKNLNETSLQNLKTYIDNKFKCCHVTYEKVGRTVNNAQINRFFKCNDCIFHIFTDKEEFGYCFTSREFDSNIKKYNCKSRKDFILTIFKDLKILLGKEDEQYRNITSI